MNKLNKEYIAPILVIAVGMGWLFNVLGVLPGVDWIWTGALGVVGVLVLIVRKLDRLTGVVGPFLIIASFCSILRQTGRLALDREVPVLTIVLGVLLLLVQVLRLPMPEEGTKD